MTQAERKVMEKVYACVNRMSGMEPSNPAYIEVKAKFNSLQCLCCANLVKSLSSLNFGDLSLAHASADEAMRVLKIAPQE